MPYEVRHRMHGQRLLCDMLLLNVGILHVRSIPVLFAFYVWSAC